MQIGLWEARQTNITKRTISRKRLIEAQNVSIRHELSNGFLPYSHRVERKRNEYYPLFLLLYIIIFIMNLRRRFTHGLPLVGQIDLQCLIKTLNSSDQAAFAKETTITGTCNRGSKLHNGELLRFHINHLSDCACIEVRMPRMFPT